MPFSFKPTQDTGNSSPEPSQVGATGTSSQTSSSTLPSSALYPDSRLPGKRDVVKLAVFGIFGATVGVAIILFVYQQYLTSQFNSKKSQLVADEAKLGALPLTDMRKLSNRMKAVNQLVKDHASVRVAFRIIEDSIENPVTYKNFDLHFSESTRLYQLNLGAVARDYHSIVQQIETLKDKDYTKYLPSVTLEGLHPDDTGLVAFNLKMPIVITGILPEEVLPVSTDNTIEELTATSGPVIIYSSSTSTKTSTSSPPLNVITPKKI